MAMTLFRTLLWCFATLAFVIAPQGMAAPLSGTKSVGPTGNYASITAAIADIQAESVGGALILELQAAYVSTVETFPLVVPTLNGASAVNTVTIRPESGAAGLSIVTGFDGLAGTVDLNGAQFVTIDGRAGGVGTARQLTIASTSIGGVALRFINEASGNTLEYLTLRGVSTSTTSGTVVFSTTTSANGNDNNTIDTCDIGDGATTPANGIYSLGSTGTSAQNNSGNTVSNCNIFNFHRGTAVDVAGVRLDGGNDSWTITGNSFYQTVSRAAVGANVRAIYVNNTSGNNFTVSGNFVGGDSPGAAVSIQKWTTTGTPAAYQFQGIQLNVGTAMPSSVQGNNIRNMVWTTGSNASTPPGIWSGIHVQAGDVVIGTVSGNTIGSSTGTGSISVTSSSNAGNLCGTTFGIASNGSGTVVIANNTIGSVTASGAGITISASLVGIQVTAGAKTIAGNTVGSTTTANSLNANTASTSTSTVQQVTGILSSSSTSASITGNTVANLNNNFNSSNTSLTSQIRGIVTSAGANNITGNTVRNLSTTSQNTNSTTLSAVLGISQSSTVAGQTVSQNVVHSLASTAASVEVSVTGIFYSGSDGTNVIARNLVHSLSCASSNAASAVTGMQFDAGTFTVQSNMVRVGLNAAGTGTAGAATVRGIFEAVTASGRNFYHNSVYVGGTQTSGAASTYAFTSAIASGARTIQDNIFVNARGNSGGTGKHYAVQYGGITGLPTGLIASNNIFLASGTGGVLGSFNSIDRTTLAAWQSATGVDSSSAFVDPMFVNPTGDATTGDLHLQASNPAEGGGIPIEAVTDDFDGQTRSSFTPTDIGADAGNFTSTGDVIAPAISYTPLSNASNANRTLTAFATITDNSGTVPGGTSVPRLYFKKAADADVFGVPNNATGNGWKSVAANNASSPYGFTIDYSLINGASVNIGDVVRYFVVAQDAADNLGSAPAGATAAGTPAVQNVNGHGGVNSYTIVPAMSGTRTVGPAGD